MSEHRLNCEERLVYPGLNGHLGACHLRVYGCRGNRPVGIAGSFDDPVGTSITNAIESVARAISERLGTGRFTLIEWWPHTGCPFVEVGLRRVRATLLPFGRIVTLGQNGTVAVDTTRRVKARFADPDWRLCDEDRIAVLIGADALSEVTGLAGEPGEYNAERVFGLSGRARIQAVCRHNHERLSGIKAQLAESGIT